MTEVGVVIGAEQFHWSGATPTSPGFTAVYPWQEVHGMETTVEWNQDQQWNVEQVNNFGLINAVACMFLLQVKLTEHETTPPGYLTESELITLMEKHGIGTVRNGTQGMQT